MIAFHSGKSAHRARALSTGHDSMRSDVPLASQIARQFIISDAIDASFKSRFTVGPLAGSAGFQSHTHPRHSNPHSARGTTLRSLSAVSFLGGFRTPAAEHAAPSLKRPASETLHMSGNPSQLFLRKMRSRALAIQYCTARFNAYLERCTSRISNTGHSGAVVPVHWATVFANRRSSLRRSLIFVRISSRWCAAISWTSRQEAFSGPPSRSKARTSSSEKPNSRAIKCRWNAHRKAELPWSYEVTKCASGQAISCRPRPPSSGRWFSMATPGGGSLNCTLANGEGCR